MGPQDPGGLFRKSIDSKEMLQDWEDIHSGAKSAPGDLSTEVNHAVGEDAVPVHHVFKDPDSLVHYFTHTAAKHMGGLDRMAQPELHFIRGEQIPDTAREAVMAKNVPGAFRDLLVGYVKEEYRRPDYTQAIMVTAKRTRHPGAASHADDLR